MVISLRSIRAARQLPDPLMLARSLEATVTEAWERNQPAWSATTALHDARSRGAVRAATSELRSLALALRDAQATDPEALRLCLALIEDGFDSPLYAGNADALRRESGRLRFRLIARRAS
jgi:hypothetical protein